MTGWVEKIAALALKTGSCFYFFVTVDYYHFYLNNFFHAWLYDQYSFIFLSMLNCIRHRPFNQAANSKQIILSRIHSSIGPLGLIPNHSLGPCGKSPS